LRPNLSKSYVPCTFEFLISVAPHLKHTISGYPSVGLEVKYRPMARQVGVLVDDPLENSMASFSFASIVLHEGTTFVFGS
jgi:hypothetical protein